MGGMTAQSDRDYLLKAGWKHKPSNETGNWGEWVSPEGNGPYYDWQVDHLVEFERKKKWR